MVEKIQYLYFFSEKYKVYFVRREDGMELDYVPDGLLSEMGTDIYKLSHDRLYGLVDPLKRELDDEDVEDLFDYYDKFIKKGITK